MLGSRSMPLWSTALRPGPCPACDGPLSADLAGTETRPACQHCGVDLYPLKVAGFWRRLLACVLDLMVLMLTAAPLQFALHRALKIAAPVHGDLSLDTGLRWLALPPTTVLLWIIPFLGISIAYVVIFTALSGATPGQRAIGLRVVSNRGQRPGFGRALVRALGLIVGLAPGGLGALWIAFDREKRGFHDHLARTLVVRGAR